VTRARPSISEVTPAGLPVASTARRVAPVAIRSPTAPRTLDCISAPPSRTRRSASWCLRLARRAGKSTCVPTATASWLRSASLIACAASRGPAATQPSRTSNATASNHPAFFISELQVQGGAQIVHERRQRRQVALERRAQARPGHGGVGQRTGGHEVAPAQVVDESEVARKPVRRAYQHVAVAVGVAAREGRSVRGRLPGPGIVEDELAHPPLRVRL